jgi:uncharacterized delta-60 repeat protein
MRKRTVVWLLLVVGVASLGFYFFRPQPAALPTPRSRRLVASGPTPAPVPAAPTPVLAMRAPTPALRAEKNPRPDSVIASAWLSETRPAMAAFADWTARYLNATAAQRTGLLIEGLDLAQQRRAALAALIPTDPEQALADAVPMVVRQQLPAEILALLEERVSAQGDLELLAGSSSPGQAAAVSIYRSTLINGREYRAYAYGRRATLATLPKTSIIGIAVDQALAVSDSPVRVLEAGELPGSRAVTNVCVISGNVTPVNASAGLNLATPTAVEANGQIYVLCCETHLNLYEQNLIKAEQANYEVVEADGAPGSSDVTGRPSSAWTHGTKKVLIIVVDFSDLPGTPVNPYDPVANTTNTPITTSYIVNRYNQPNGVRDFFDQASYSQADLQIGAVVSGASPDVTPVLRMPSTAASYATAGANTLLHSDAEILAANAGYDVASYDRIGVVFSDLGGIPNSQITYGGLGEVIGPDFWINGYFNLSQVSHEMGHTFGLNHANLWSVTDGNPVSPNGTSVEYGDPFDVMGSGLTEVNQYTQWNRSILEWIPDSAVTTISTSGTYRVYTFDNPAANITNALALKIVRDDTHDYWIGYRTNSGNANLNDGAYVLWGYNDNQQGNLLNLTNPGNTATNPALEVGSTFNDTAAGITLETLDKGGSGAGAYLDLAVTFQPRIEWSQATFYADEQIGQATLTVVRIDNGVAALSVHYATADGSSSTPADNATAPADYTAQSGNVSWAAGDLSPKTITIPITPGAFASGVKAFTVTLSNPTGAVIADNAAATVDLGAPGAPDPGFALFFVNSAVNRVLVQPDGKILAAGWFSGLEDANFTLYNQGGIARFNADGTVDVPFDSTGGVTGNLAVVYDCARQPDGKLILAGNFTAVNGTPANNLARLNTDGSLDTSFQSGTGPDNVVYATLAQPDGKIIIGGAFLHYNGTACPFLARLNANGSLDTTFTGPSPSLGNGTAGWYVQSLALQPDGKLLVGGEFYIPGNATFKSGLCRLNTNGTLDANFNGVVQGATASGNTSSLLPVNRIAVQLDGNIVIAGNFTAYNNVARGGLARVTSTGALDPTFAPTTNGTCEALLVQPDGKILVGGNFSTVNGATASNFVRLTSAGATDPLFPSTTGPSAAVSDFALQPDGELLYGGDFGNFQTVSDTPMWRFFSGVAGLPGTVQWSVASADGTPGDALVLTATRTGGSSGALSVNYATDAAGAALTGVTPATGTLSWATGDSASKTASIPLASSANGTLLVNLGAPLLGGALLNVTQQTTVDIASLTFATWQAEYFTSSQLANPLISGSTADPNGDSLSNVLDYAFGLNPLVRTNTNTSPAGLSQVTIQNIGGVNYLTITFRERTPPGDLTYTPQTSNSAAGPWTANAVLVGTPVNNGDGTETVTYRDSVPFGSSNSLRFMRVYVTVAQ